MRLARLHRRSAEGDGAHARARELIVQRLDEPLAPDQAAWLEGHLERCDPCRVEADAFLADRSALRALRAAPIDPPRDLWARTAASIERESARRQRTTLRPLAAIPLGALTGVLVLGVVLGASLLSQSIVGPAAPSAPAIAFLPSAAASTGAGPRATPMAIRVGDVSWLMQAGPGRLEVNVAPVDRVCAPEARPDCAPIQDQVAGTIEVGTEAHSIISAPDDRQAVVVGRDGGNGDRVVVVQLSPATPSPTVAPATEAPSSSPTVVASASTAVTPTASPTSSSAAAASVIPSAAASSPPRSSSPSTTASAAPSLSAAPSARPSPSALASPSGASSSPDATPTPTATLAASPSPSATATALAIATDVTVVGESAAYSADGGWFAFTAMPANGAHGPDIYVWHAGDAQARPITADHRSAFASWHGGSIVGSRPSAAGSSRGVQPQTFLVDPRSGTVTDLPDPIWRPIVDPKGRRAVAWNGTVSTEAAVPRPDNGRLELRTWAPGDGAAGSALETLDNGPIGEYDVRWDETGEWLAVWIADPATPSIGRLSLFAIDPETGALRHPHSAPTDVPALPGFSIGNGRLAWATPRGQEGEGSKVLIAAWTKDGVGTAEGPPGQDVIVVR
ncbi:MAG: zf-HC2 domain-containing protein [Chloroflexota bacterium]